MPRRRAVFLDRDGVLNRQMITDGKVDMLASPDDFEWLPDVIPALARLRNADFALIVVTNQPDVSRGRLPMQTLELIHDRMTADFRFDAVYTCPHTDNDACECRKPKTGMIDRGAREHNIDPASSFLVGDRGRDIEAGRRAGCSTILIRWPYSGDVSADYEAANLSQAADIILNRTTAAT